MDKNEKIVYYNKKSAYGFVTFYYDFSKVEHIFGNVNIDRKYRKMLN